MNEPALNDKSMVDLMMVVLLIHLNLNKKQLELLILQVEKMQKNRYL